MAIERKPNDIYFSFSAFNCALNPEYFGVKCKRPPYVNIDNAALSNTRKCLLSWSKSEMKKSREINIGTRSVACRKCDDHSLLTQNQRFHIRSIIDDRQRGIYVLFIIDVDLIDGRHHQMPVTDFPFDNAFGKIQCIHGATDNVLQFDYLPSGCFCLQIFARFLLFDDVSE